MHEARWILSFQYRLFGSNLWSILMYSNINRTTSLLEWNKVGRKSRNLSWNLKNSFSQRKYKLSKFYKNHKFLGKKSSRSTFVTCHWFNPSLVSSILMLKISINLIQPVQAVLLVIRQPMRMQKIFETILPEKFETIGKPVDFSEQGRSKTFSFQFVQDWFRS